MGVRKSEHWHNVSSKVDTYGGVCPQKWTPFADVSSKVDTHIMGWERGCPQKRTLFGDVNAPSPRQPVPHPWSQSPRVPSPTTAPPAAPPAALRHHATTTTPPTIRERSTSFRVFRIPLHCVSLGGALSGGQWGIEPGTGGPRPGYPTLPHRRPRVGDYTCRCILAASKNLHSRTNPLYIQ